MSGRSSKAAADNRANQMNPNNDAYYSSRGMSSSDSARMSGGYGSGGGGGASSDSGLQSQAAADNRANQMNPNNPSYAKSRGG